MMTEYQSDYEYETVEEETIEEEIVEEKEQWILLDNFPGFAISSIHPHLIKDIVTEEIAKESLDGNGYVRVKIDGKSYPKHRVIAEQFIPNPKNLPDVDHINRVRDDNRLENLRWCSRADNNKNRSACNGFKYEYVDELPEGAQPFREYKGRKLKNLYRKDNDFYYDIGPHFRKVPVCNGKGVHIKIFIHLL